MKILLAICWWGTVLATVLMGVIGTLTVFDPGRYLDVVWIGFDSSVDSSPLSAITRDGLKANVKFQDPVRLKFVMPAEFWEPRRGLVAFGGILLVALLGLFLYFLRLLRQIVRTVEAGNSFVSDNARRLRSMERRS